MLLIGAVSQLVELCTTNDVAQNSEDVKLLHSLTSRVRELIGSCQAHADLWSASAMLWPAYSRLIQRLPDVYADPETVKLESIAAYSCLHAAMRPLVAACASQHCEQAAQSHLALLRLMQAQIEFDGGKVLAIPRCVRQAMVCLAARLTCS
jgi:hypothetical protein